MDRMEQPRRSGRFLGIEIGGTKQQLALGRPGSIEVIERRQADRSRAAAGILEQIEGALGSLLGRDGTGSRLTVDAVGIGFGGPVDAVSGRVIVSHQVDGWAGFPIVDWVRERTSCPRVALGNDSDTAALAEALHGAGAGLSPVLYVNSGSGVGSGLILDRRIYTGGSGVGAMELGHLRIDGLGEETEGLPPTVEDLASGWAIGRLASGEGEAPVPVPEVARRAREGDYRARTALRTATLAMARGLAHAVTLLAPQRIILGGGVSLLPDELWLEPIRVELERRVFPPFRGTYDLATARLGEEVVLHGALALAEECWTNRT
jgi:glucokinase